MDDTTLLSIVFYGPVIDVFNKHLDIYSLFLLSKTSKKSSITYKTKRHLVLAHKLKTADRKEVDRLVESINTTDIPLTCKYPSQCFDGLMTRILDLTLDESEYGPNGIDKYILDYRSTMFFCMYGKSLDYFVDHEHETYEY